VEARYEFDFRAGRCVLYSVGQDPQEKTIPPAAARRFARRAYEACHTREPDQAQRYRTVDAGHCSAQVFGLSFHWDALGDQFLSPACRTLSAAFRDLIDSLMD
jgi:hypothetical protein